MSKAGIICEFNPFHNGHKFLIEKIKSAYADDVICIMSGNFVQRGDIAITDKYARTAAALAHGADMVVELPTVYAVASAQGFAENGVRIAASLGCDRLCFGAENSTEELSEVADALSSAETQAAIAAGMKTGVTYPQAVSEALGADAAQLIRKPNNILAVEYIRACRRCGMIPVALPRAGVSHDAETPVGEYASASAIRERILCGGSYREFTPMTIDVPASLTALEPVILYKLKTIDKDELALLPDVSEGLENRIYETAIRYHSLEEILEQVKTKRYTMARLRRILICSLLDITRRLQETPVPYVRVLGVRKGSPALMKSAELPLIVDVRRGYDALHNSAKEIFDIDLTAAQAMNIARKTSLNEFSHGVVKES